MDHHRSSSWFPGPSLEDLMNSPALDEVIFRGHEPDWSLLAAVEEIILALVEKLRREPDLPRDKALHFVKQQSPERLRRRRPRAAGLQPRSHAAPNAIVRSYDRFHQAGGVTRPRPTRAAARSIHTLVFRPNRRISKCRFHALQAGIDVGHGGRALDFHFLRACCVSTRRCVDWIFDPPR